LEVLECRTNKISRLPDLSRLAYLKRLDAMENKITEIPLIRPSRRKAPPTLAFINLGCNLLENFDPYSLGDQTALAELHVAGNALKTLPGSICTLPSLKVLDISNNALADIPYTLGYMKDLHRVSAAGNPIRTIRQSLLTSSTSSVETEKLKQFLRTRGPNPYELEEGAAVHVFTSSSSSSGPSSGCASLKTATDTHGSLTHTVELRIREVGGQQKELDLSKLELTSLDLKSTSLIDRLLASPHCVDERAGTICLLKLNLSGNSIGPHFPAELGELRHLRSLDLRENKLGASPLEPGDSSALGGLISLDLSGNKVRDLGVIARNISRLQVLLASNNDIDALSPNLALLTDLRELCLSHNRRLSRLDTVDFSRLQSLTILDVSNCHISDISALESASSKFQTLLLDNNDLGSIPSFIGKFPSMICVSFYGNPQRNVRQAIMDRGTGAILELLRSRIVS
jgi:Leucine-rich repeat (LRR) protein